MIIRGSPQKIRQLCNTPTHQSVCVHLTIILLTGTVKNMCVRFLAGVRHRVPFCLDSVYCKHVSVNTSNAIELTVMKEIQDKFTVSWARGHAIHTKQ